MRGTGIGNENGTQTGTETEIGWHSGSFIVVSLCKNRAITHTYACVYIAV